MAPQPGDYLTVRTSGLPAWVIRRVTNSPVNHAAIYVGNGMVIEGRPGGAGYADLDSYPDAYWSKIPLTEQQRHAIIAAAVRCLHVPYNWVDDLDIGLGKVFGLHTPDWIARRLSRPDRMMCSQLVDYCYWDAGVNLFLDGRPPGAITPGDLYDRSH